MTSLLLFYSCCFHENWLLAIHPQLRLLFRASAGAFFSLHCLIYKVHTVLNGSLLFYHIHIRLSSTFFKFSFQTSFAAAVATFSFYHTQKCLSRTFFKFFFNSLPLSCSNFISLPHRAPLVKLFFSAAFAAHRVSRRPRSTASLDYQILSRLSTTFFILFRFFSY